MMHLLRHLAHTGVSQITPTQTCIAEFIPLVVVPQDSNTYVYYMEDGAFKSKYSPMDGVKLSQEAIMKAMPEFVSTVFPAAKFCPVMKTVTVDGAVFDLKSKVIAYRSPLSHA